MSCCYNSIDFSLSTQPCSTTQQEICNLFRTTSNFFIEKSLPIRHLFVFKKTFYWILHLDLNRKKKKKQILDKASNQMGTSAEQQSLSPVMIFNYYKKNAHCHNEEKIVGRFEWMHKDEQEKTFCFSFCNRDRDYATYYDKKNENQWWVG